MFRFLRAGIENGDLTVSVVTHTFDVKTYYPNFAATMSKAIALLKSCVAEVKSRELPIKSELSFVIVSDEFETAGEILRSSNNEALVRASGVIAGRTRHFWRKVSVLRLLRSTPGFEYIFRRSLLDDFA